MARISFEELKARARETFASWRERAGALVERARSRLPRRPAGVENAPLIEDPSLKGPKAWVMRAKRELPRLADLASAMGEKALQSLKAGGIGAWGTGTAVVLSAWFLADVTALMLESYVPEPPAVFTGAGGGQGERPKMVGAYDGIARRNLFNSRGLIPGEGGPTQPGQTEDPDGPCINRTTLTLNLLGTLITRDKVHSIATIEDRGSNDVYPVRAGDEVPSKLRVVDIEARKVCFVNLSTGRKEFIDLPEDEAVRPARTATRPAPSTGGIAKKGQTQFNVPRTEIDSAMSDLNKVLTQARAVPHFENGVPAGYKLFQIVPGSIYDKLGLTNGDVIAGVNGEPMADPSKAFEMLNELKSSKHVEINIKRNGKEETLVYDIN
ncbi:MAG: hypothetical protein IT285_13410 [Bdellovibrionales bacterium]|nr:hypothetical protein [Bdellovibrionales bacterium]